MLNIVDYNDSDDDEGEGSSRSSETNERKSKTDKRAQNDVLSIESDIPVPTASPWQELVDESSGYTYYWHKDTDQVTWDEPPEFKQYKLELLKYYERIKAQRRNIAIAAATALYKQQQEQKQKQKLLNQNTAELEALHLKEEDESDEDVKIELITSFKNNDTISDSDEGEKSSPPQTKRKKLNEPHKEPKEKKSKKSTKVKSDITFGPELPQLNFNLELPPGLDQQKPLQHDSLEENALAQLMRDGAATTSSATSESEEETKEVSNKTNDALKRVAKQKYDSSKESELKDSKPKYKMIKLSARGKELIQASITTEKAREATFTTTPEQLEENVNKDNGTKEELDVPKEQHQSTSRTDKEEEVNENKFAQNDSRRGFGFSSNDNSGKVTSRKFKIAFIRPRDDSDEDDENDENENPVEPSSNENIDGECLLDLSTSLSQQLNALSENQRVEISPFEKIKLQFEVLKKAWEQGALSSSYLLTCCTQMSQQIKQLQKERLPPGWKALWDKIQKRYCYLHEKNKKTQYQFPIDVSEQNGVSPSNGVLVQNENHRLPSASVYQISNGEEDMDISNTPPQSPIPTPSRFNNINADVPLPPGTEDVYIRPPLPSPPPLPPCPPEIDDSPPPPPPPPSITPPPPLPPSPPCISPLPVNPPLPQPESSFYYPAPRPKTPPLPLLSVSQRSKSPEKKKSKEDTTKTTETSDLLSELDSFYSDIASVVTQPDDDTNQQTTEQNIGSTSTSLGNNQVENPTPSVSSSTSTSVVNKKKKKTKVGPGLSMKKKNVSSLVAKWQQVQNDLQ